MTREERAWVGAYIEADGSIELTHTPRGSPRGRVYVYSAEIEALSTCLRLVGTGGICMTHGGRNGNRPEWVWYVEATTEVIDLLRYVRPYLTDKREKADEVVAAVTSQTVARYR